MADGLLLGSGAGQNPLGGRHALPHNLHLPREVPPPCIVFTRFFHPWLNDYHLNLPRSFWPEGELDGLPVMGLALGDYTLMPLWIWIYCLIWWFIQVGLLACLLPFSSFLSFHPNRVADCATACRMRPRF
jgi:hypothetical protein